MDLFVILHFPPRAIDIDRGAVAQLGERLPRTEEVGGSNPLCSTRYPGDILQYPLSLRLGGLWWLTTGAQWKATQYVFEPGRARRGASGALNPKSAEAGSTTVPEGG